VRRAKDERRRTRTSWRWLGSTRRFDIPHLDADLQRGSNLGEAITTKIFREAGLTHPSWNTTYTGKSQLSRHGVRVPTYRPICQFAEILHLERRVTKSHQSWNLKTDAGFTDVITFVCVQRLEDVSAVLERYWSWILTTAITAIDA
jgi:hypothetical protein